MPYIPKYKQEIFQELISIVVAQSELTDVNPGSALTHILGSVASEIELVELRLQDIRDSFSLDGASGKDLDYRVQDLPPAGLSRQSASFARGAVLQFTFSDALEADLVIPAGSRFGALGNSELIYSTVADVTVPEGSTVFPAADSSSYVTVVCSLAGTTGNQAASQITRIISAPGEIVAVTNPVPISGGTEQESDESLRQRAKSYLASLSRITSEGLEFVVRSYVSPEGEQARHVGVIEDPLTPGMTEVVVDPGSAGIDEELLNVVPQPDTVLDQGEEYSWEGKMPMVLHHNMCALEEIKMSDIQIAIYDKNGEYGLGAGKVVVNFDHIAVREFYGIPQDVNPFISVHERGHLYTDSFFPMNYAPNFGYDPNVLADKAFKTKPVEITLKPFLRYTGLVARVQRLIEGSPSNPSLYPGYRPAGCRVIVRLPLLQYVGGMEINLTLNEGLFVSDFQEEVRLEVANIVAELAPGESLKRAEIISRLMGLSYINNVEITSPTDDVDAVSARHSLRINPLEIKLT